MLWMVDGGSLARPGPSFSVPDLEVAAAMSDSATWSPGSRMVAALESAIFAIAN